MLAAERNVLLGSWRVDSGGQAGGAGLGQGNGTDRNAMARELLTTMGPASVRPAFTVASASPPCAPTPGISSGSVGASARTRAISAG